MSYCYHPCYNYCYEPCQYVCQPVCPPVTQVALTTSPATTTVVAPGGTSIPNGTIYNPALFPPAGTVTVITGFPGVTPINVGGITINPNGIFTLPIAGQYTISASANFTPVTPPASGNVRLSVYRISTAGVISLLTTNVAVANATTVTNIPVSINTQFVAGDRVFFATTSTVSSFTVETNSVFSFFRNQCN